MRRIGIAILIITAFYAMVTLYGVRHELREIKVALERQPRAVILQRCEIRHVTLTLDDQ